MKRVGRRSARKPGPPFSLPPPEVGRYTPTRARRLATQARHLWRDMQFVVKEMLRLANEHDPDSLSEQRMALRTIENILRGFSPEHRLWARLRQSCADRDEDHSLFRFVNEVAEVVEHRLDNIEADIAQAASGKLGITTEELFGSAFCSKVAVLRAVYSDWITIFGMLDMIDYTGTGATDDLAADDTALAAIELRAIHRRNATTPPPAKSIDASSRRRAKRRSPG